MESINLKKRPEESFDEYCHRISSMRVQLNKTWDHIAAIINANCGCDYSADKYRKQEKKYQNSLQEESENTTESIDADSEDSEDVVFCNAKESISTNFEKNETTSSKEMALTPEQLRNPNALLRAHGFDPEYYDIKTCTNAKTTKMTLDGSTCVYNSKIVVKSKTASDINLNDIEKLFETFEFKKRNNIKINPKQYDPEGEFLEICLQDLHMGLLSYEPETGEDYDIYIAKDRLENCINDIYQRSKGRKFKRIVLALLGDLLHSDNVAGTTSAGTRQDLDTRPTKIFEWTLNLLIETIEKLGEIAPVEIINLQGNHDSLTNFCLAKSLEMAFRNEPNVVFYNSPNPRKWKRYGQCIIGWSHGDMKSNAVSEWLSNECDEWSLAKYREVHLGHLHSLQTLQKIEDNKYGLIVRYLPALCASSAWEHSMGFPKSQRGMMTFVWNEDKGLREIWYSNI